MKNETVKFIGVDDREIDLFESQYLVPEGMCYNSYLVLGEKIAVMDSVDARKTGEWMEKLSAALDGRKPDYIVVQHMEPDHSGSIAAFLNEYPETVVVCSAQATKYLLRHRPKTQFGASDLLKMHPRRAIHAYGKARTCWASR